MNIEQIHRMQSDFDSLAQTFPNDGSIEFWFARDLQEPLGYARWENFITAIQRAIESCETTGYKSEHHFRGVTKMVALGSVMDSVSIILPAFRVDKIIFKKPPQPRFRLAKCRSAKYPIPLFLPSHDP